VQCLRWLVACLAVAAVPAWNDYRHEKEFAANSALAMGKVLTKTRSRAGSVTVLGVTKDVIEYSVRYRFATPSGKQVEGTAKVTPEEWGILEERGPVKIRYLPDHPETSHVPGQQSSQSWMERLIFTLIGGGFTAFGSILLFFVLKARKEEG
jgi:hypothetical protein